MKFLENDTSSIILAGGWVVSILLITVLLVGRWYYQSKVEELTAIANELSHVNDVNRAAIDSLSKELAATNVVLLQRDKDLERLKTAADMEQKSLRETIKNDPKSKSWGDTDIPDAVLQRLHSDGHSDPDGHR